MKNHFNLFKKIEEQELQAKEFGFYWENINQLLEQIENECQEVKEAAENQDLKHLEEEIGDLLLAAVSLSIFCKVNPSESLAKSVAKFQKRYDALKILAEKDGLTHLHHQPIEVLMNYWKQAKKQTAS